MRPLRSFLTLLLAFALCFAASRLGSLATTPNLDWYHSLRQPFFQPPDWAFPVVWTILYAMMAVSLWRIASRPLTKHPRSVAMGVFMLQLLLNIGWSFAFFGQQNPQLGLVVIGALLVAIAWNIAVFRSLDRLAGLLLIPYFLWVCYATLLNLAIWWLNP
jgi:tryptophan-rich sensory protein